MMSPTAGSFDVSKTHNATPPDHFSPDHFALKPPVQPAPAPGVQTAPDGSLLPPGGASAPPDPRLTRSVHAWLFGGPLERTGDNVTGGAYNFSENDALLRFRHENAPLLDALGAEFNDDQLMRIAGKVAGVLQQNAPDGLRGVFGFHLLPADTQNALLANMRAAIWGEAARIRDEARPETPAQQPQPGPSEQHWPDWTRFVVPDAGSSNMPATPTIRDPIPSVTFNEMPTTQTRRAPAPLDPETLAAMQENAQRALELEALQSKLQDEIDGILGQHAGVIAEGRGPYELRRLERESTPDIIPGPISDPDVLGALAQRVLERAKELAADGYPHYADALIRAFRERYPEFGGESEDQGASGEPGRVQRELERGSEFTTGESYGDSVAEEARRMREGGDPTGALELMAEYLRSHGAPMEGATGGTDVARSASTAIMNELRNMPVFDAARLVHELGDELDRVRPEYRAILEDILKNGHEDVLTNEYIEEVPNFVRSALQKLYDAKRSEEFRAEGALPEFSASEITRNLQDTIDLLVVYEDAPEMFDGSMVDMSGIPASIARLEAAIRAVNDPAYSAEIIEGIAALLPEIGEYSRNLLADLFTALRDTLRVPPGEDTPRFEDARNLIEPFIPGRDGAGEG